MLKIGAMSGGNESGKSEIRERRAKREVERERERKERNMMCVKERKVVNLNVFRVKLNVA